MLPRWRTMICRTCSAPQVKILTQVSRQVNKLAFSLHSSVRGLAVWPEGHIWLSSRQREQRGPSSLCPTHDSQESSPRRQLTTASVTSLGIRSSCCPKSTSDSRLLAPRVKRYPSDTQGCCYCSSSSSIFTFDQPIKAKFMEDIDFDSLKKQVASERKKTGGNVGLTSRMKEILNEKARAYMATLSPEQTKALKIIQLEYSFFYSEGYEILSPEEMTDMDWLEALECKTKNARFSFFVYLSQKAHHKATAKIKNTETKKSTEFMMTAYPHGRLFHRIYPHTMKRFLHERLASYIQHGLCLPFVVDMDYEAHMVTKEVRNTAKQLTELYGYNRQNRDPFHLYFTSASKNNSINRFFQLYNQEAPFLGTCTEKSYLEVFDKEKLIYLSPDSNVMMKSFDPEAVYIIGAYVDKGKQEPVSFARAKKQGIKSMKLPIDKYTLWQQGSKSLTLDQMIRILMTLRETNSWQKAFQHIPSRKLVSQNMPRPDPGLVKHWK